MPASFLSADSPASSRSRELLAGFPEFADRPGLSQARMLVDYVLGRRGGELDVSGRSTEGTFVSAEALAQVPQNIIVIDDAHGLQTALLSHLAEVAGYHDRIDEAMTVARICGATELETLEMLAGRETSESADSAESAESVESDESADEQTDQRETWAVINAPKATNALAETITALQPHVSTVIVVGRSDAMSRAVNKELSRGFARVDVSPGVGKHRLIIGSRTLSSPSLRSFPKHGVIDHPATGPLEVRAHGACFSGVKSDEGSSLLLDALAESRNSAAVDVQSDPNAAPVRILDLGCGNGWLLTAALRVTGASTGVGVDVSKAAVASARATAEANGTTVDIHLADATVDRLDHLGEFDLILLNPPFHQGTAIETDTAAGLICTAARMLAPGGEALTVFNSHLRYRELLERHIGPSEQLARTSKFTVIGSRGDQGQ